MQHTLSRPHAMPRVMVVHLLQQQQQQFNPPPLASTVAIQRRDTGEWATSRGMVDAGQTIAQTLFDEFIHSCTRGLEDHRRRCARSKATNDDEGGGGRTDARVRPPGGAEIRSMPLPALAVEMIQVRRLLDEIDGTATGAGHAGRWWALSPIVWVRRRRHTFAEVGIPKHPSFPALQCQVPSFGPGMEL